MPTDAGRDAVTRAYAVCERIARRHYENFPVASILLPASMRPHIAAIYAFARSADDFADEGDLPPARRLALLDDWGRRLRASAPDVVGQAGPESRVPSPAPEAIFLALSHTIRACSLPVALFEDLLSAFRQDVVTTRYATWADVMDYCRRSANPVGRLVLRVAGHAEEGLDRASDAVCTALQLTNFWQDLERDWRKGRLYVPRDERERFGAREADLDARVMSAAWREALSEMAARTRRLFAEGRAVCDGLGGRLRYELRLTWLGGMRVLDRLERAGFDVFRARPSLGSSDIPALLWGAVAWGRPRPA
ncbi:MAG TPA: squalene synthase HpnC [Vicinamibacterales bacterium]|nr:squalene synthase HpnC [Vicinamibacterales bacterium]